MMPTNAHVEQKKLITYLQNLSKDDMSSIKPRGLDCLYSTRFSHAIHTEKSVLCEATKSLSRDGNNANVVTRNATYRDEELASIRSWSSVRHAEVIGCLMLELEVFVSEFLSIN